MINKKSAWFLTLFSLILVLSVYYITMPPELLIAQPNNINKEETSPVVNVEESSILVALRVESDEELDNEINKLKKIVSNSESTIEEKNKAFEKIKDLNNTRSIEETLEKLIKTEYKLNSFIKIKENNIEVIVNSSEHNMELANQIMRIIQAEFDTSKNISVKFQK
jgi:stage III sporulation protein AH